MPLSVKKGGPKAPFDVVVFREKFKSPVTICQVLGIDISLLMEDKCDARTNSRNE